MFAQLRAQAVLSLDSCRELAMNNNKELLMSNEQIRSAHYQHKAAFTNYLPKISATGAYIHTQKNLSLISDQQASALNNMGTTVGGAVQQYAQQIATAYPELVPLISSLGVSLTDPLNAVGSEIAGALQPHTRNMYTGAITLTQPLFMGGKIRAYNKITGYVEDIAQLQHNASAQEVILNTDQAYWQVVSLVNKKKLAESYLKLLQQMSADVDRMIAEGVATKADGLSVSVKVNEAEMTLTKVDDGLSLARMLLCQLCGLDLSTPIALTDEVMEDIPTTVAALSPTDSTIINKVYATRPEIQALELGKKVYQQKITVARADYLPSLVLTGGYLISNPSLFNGFEQKFRGMWNVGVAVQIPIWNWGEGIYKVKAAKAEARMAEYQLDDVKEKVKLQVNQAAFKVNEAVKRLATSQKNMEKANENLRYASLGFEEGVIPTLNLLEAQTAWLSAHSEKIDAQIDVKLTDTYLKKSLGTLGTIH
jgi:outer membrane protein TolC